MNTNELRLPIECYMCGTVYGITVQDADYWSWAAGTPAQTAFPYLSAADRELIISQTCGQCFDIMFGDEE